MPAHAKAKLTEKRNPRAELEFDFNPKELSITRGGAFAEIADRSSQEAVNGPYLLTDWTGTYLDIKGLLFRGTSTWNKIQQLRTWYEPDNSTKAKRGGSTAFSWRRSQLIFQWGAQGVTADVEITSLTLSLTRFAANGAPIAATVGLTLHVLHQTLRATNPTSGGLPGRHTATVVQGQNLQSIALDSYGSPAHWRDVARLNGIEDPLRVRAGDVVYLPNRDELHAGGAG